MLVLLHIYIYTVYVYSFYIAKKIETKVARVEAAAAAQVGKYSIQNTLILHH